MSEESEGTSARRLVVLYGSQTGTAHDVAERVARMAQRRYFHTRVLALDQYNLAKLVQEPLALFIVATTGQGDPPDNMLTFWKFILRKNLPVNSLKSLQCAVLGLGDSSYMKFNFIAKKLHRRLEQLGAEQLHVAGLADEQHDLGQEAVIGPWLESLWNTIMSIYPLPPTQAIIPQNLLLPAKFELIPCVMKEKLNGVSENSANHSKTNSMYSAEHPFKALLTGNERVTGVNHWQDVRLLTFDLSSSGIKYDAGDILYIAPQNKDQNVDEFLALLNLNGDEKFTLRPRNSDFKLPATLPMPCTWRYIAKHYLDISGTPRSYFWEIMAHFTPSELEKEKFTEFTTAEGQDDLFDYVHRPRRNIMEILADFSDAARSIPAEYVFDMIPVLQPRAFSIASSQAMYPDQAQLLVAVVRYKSKRLVKPREGVCSTWLAATEPGSKTTVPVWVQKGTIRFPTSDIPVIIVGPGTGVAPFRNFIQERIARNLGNNVLFFGCRNKDFDFFCKDEWMCYCEKGLLKMYTAFSRDQEDKVYVQHRIKEQGPLLWDLLHNKGAVFCVAGNAKNMPDAVRDALTEVIEREGGVSEQEAKEYLRYLDRQRRYQAETWS